MKKRSFLACDFETSFTDHTKTARQVVLAGFSWLGSRSEKVTHYFSIEDFFDAVARFDGRNDRQTILFFHNLDYDSSYIEDYLLREHIEFSETRNFSSKDIYKMEINYWGHKLEIYDSLKLYPSSIEKLGEMVGLEKLVGNYDYDRLRVKRQDFSNVDFDYFDHDVIILRRVLKGHFKEHRQLRLSRSSYAFASLKSHVRQADRERDKEAQYYRRIFKPDLTREQYNFLHSAYYGGFTYADPKQTLKEQGQGFVFDVNSLYPFCMTQDYPFFDSVSALSAKDFEQLKPSLHDSHCYQIVMLKLNYLKMKQDGFPSLPKKMNFRSNEVVTSLDDLEFPYVTLTSLDLYWLFENYDVNYEFVQGFSFSEYAVEPFKEFILENNRGKEEAGRQGNALKRLMFKLTNNGSYGKFGQKPDFQDSKAVMGENDIVTFERETEELKLDEDETFNNVLIADFVTAKARNILYQAIRAVNQSQDFTFLYCDTDSIHILNHTNYTVDEYTKIAKILPINIDPQKLGYWKLENDFTRAKFLRSKAYYEESTTDGQVVKLAGVSPEGKEEIIKRINTQGLQTFKLPMLVPSRRKRRMKGGYDIEDYIKEIKPKSQRIKEIY